MSSLFMLLLVPVAVTLVGGVAAAFWSPSNRVRGWLQHFAAGVVTAALAVELLPEIEAKHHAVWVTLGSFALGGLFMFGLKALFVSIEEHREARGQQRRPIGLFVTTSVDVLVDGFVIGMGFASSTGVGAALAIGLSAEMLFLGLSIATELEEARTRWTPFLLTAGLAVALLGGALGGVLIFGDASPAVVAGGLSFGAAALLYLVTEELLVEAHEGQREGPVGAGMLFLGFLAFWAIRRAFSG